jgi:PAS domain S-box-containing protein
LPNPDASAASALQISPQSLPCGWARLDPRGVVVAVNDTLCAWVGLRGQDVQGRAFDTLLSTPARVLYQSYLQPVLRLHGQVQELSLSLKTAEGSTLDVLLYTTKLAGAESGFIDVVMAPIGRRRRIDEAFLRIKQAADLAPGMIFQLVQRPGGESHFVFLSEAVRQLYGVTPEEACASADAVLSRIDPEDRPGIAAGLARSGAAGTDWSALFRVRLADGRVRWHEAQASPRRMAHEVLVWHGHVADVTQRHALEVAQAEREALERMHKVRGEFLARISHELRTPLNGILGFAQLIADDDTAPLSPRQQGQLAIIRASGEHLLQLVNQVLEITRMDAGDDRVQLSPLALLAQIESALQMVQPLALACGVTLLATDCGADLQVNADPLRLQQVLVNLLSNAVKYNRQGGTVQVMARVAGLQAEVAVIDTGHGLSEAEQQQLFQPFRRLGARHSQTEGTGLGLVITRHLLALMDATIDVRSTPGEGSVFTCRLPLAPRHAAPLPDSARHPVVQPAAPTGSVAAGRVLYVEDNPVNVILMEAICGMCPDLDLRVAIDGASALAAVADWTPDLLLLDVHLPDTDGVTLLGALREREALRGVPAIAVSAAARAEDIFAAKAAGFDGYWTKPLAIDATLAELERWLAPGLSQPARTPSPRA